MKTIRWIIAFVAWFAIGCHQKDRPSAEGVELSPVNVQVRAVVSSRNAATEEVVGTVRAKLEARLEAKVSGRIGEMRAVPGQVVGAGDLLARLEVPEIRARLDQARAQQRQTAQDLERFTALLERGAATQAEFDGVQARARIADAAVAEAETMLGYSEVAAPFDGIVTRKLADVGDLAAPGRPLLAMEKPDALRLEANVGESLVGGLAMGQEMTVHVSSLKEPIKGTVSEMAPAADPTTRTFLVKLDLPVTDGLRSGQFGRLFVPVGDVERLLVPSGAILRRGQLDYVFVVVNERAQLRLVKAGREQDGEAEVLAGVEEGERVVVAGGMQLRDGQPLNVQP